MTKKEEVKRNIDIEQAAYDTVLLMEKDAKAKLKVALQPLIDLAIECEAPVIKGTLRERAIVSVTNREILHHFLAVEAGKPVNEYCDNLRLARTAAKECRDKHLANVKAYAIWARDEAIFALAKAEGIGFARAVELSGKLYHQYGKEYPQIKEQFRAQALTIAVDEKFSALNKQIGDYQERYEKWKRETTIASSESFKKLIAG